MNLSNLFYTHESNGKHADILNDIASSRRWGLAAAVDKHLALLVQGMSGDFHESDRMQVASTELMGKAHTNVIDASEVAEHFQSLVDEGVYVNFGHEVVKFALAELVTTEAMLARAREIVSQSQPNQMLDEQVGQYAEAL